MKDPKRYTVMLSGSGRFPGIPFAGWMKKLFFLGWILLPAGLSAQPPDDPLSPVTAVSMLGKGILFEPQAGDVDLGVSAPYKPEYGTLIKETGFRSVRIRYQGDKNPMMIAIAEGPPYDADDGALLDELENIIDDLLAKDLAVVITFYGLTDDNPGDLDKMVSWWGYVAERFKDKSHRLLFNLFVEPWRLIKHDDPQRIAVYYREITKEIRKTNPDRILIYFKVPPENASDNPYGPGTDWFITKDFNPIPPEAGIYYMWDFHVLKPDARDNVRLIEQAWEYMDSAKQVVWSGAWDAKTDDTEMWYAWPMAVEGARRFIERGIPSAYLMMFDGGTGIFDAQRDHNGNGILDEWSWPGLAELLTSGPDKWWNMLSDPGFEKDDGKWSVVNGTAYTGVRDEDHYLCTGMAAGAPVSVEQDVFRALTNNGPGKYHFLAWVRSRGTSQVKFRMEYVSSDGSYVVTSDPVTVGSAQPQMLNEELEISWSNDLLTATFSLLVEGDELEIFKTGLTSFYYDHPVINPSLWPGERIHDEDYTSRSNSVMEINGSMRSLLNAGISNDDEEIVALARAIDTVTYDLETRLIELIGTEYVRTPAGTQYRTGGYYQGADNVAYKTDVEKYIGGKDNEAYTLNRLLIDKQNAARDYLILHDASFRILFWKVYRGWPPAVEPLIPLDRQVVRTDYTLGASEEGATYRWLDCNNLNNPVWGATDDTYTPVSPGLYAVEITKNGYTVISDSVNVIVVQMPEQGADPPVRVYPNPADGKITVETIRAEELMQIRLLDMTGRLIATCRTVLPGPFTIDLPSRSGMYMLEMIFRGRKEIVKIIRQ